MGLGADFAKNDGVTLLIWRGRHDIHGTVHATAADKFTLLGTSVQIAKSIVDRVILHERRLEKTPNTTIKVADLEQQMKKAKKVK